MPPLIGIIANKTPQLIARFKSITADAAIFELVVWRVQKPFAPMGHRYKYSEVYGVGAARVTIFDNERGKGGHCHIDGVEIFMSSRASTN